MSGQLGVQFVQRQGVQLAGSLGQPVQQGVVPHQEVEDNRRRELGLVAEAAVHRVVLAPERVDRGLRRLERERLAPASRDGPLQIIQ